MGRVASERYAVCLNPGLTKVLGNCRLIPPFSSGLPLSLWGALSPMSHSLSRPPPGKFSLLALELTVFSLFAHPYL